MSALCTDKTTDLDELVGSYNVTLSLLINRHAPLQTKRVTNRPRIPSFNCEIISAIGVRRIAERKWRKTKSESDLAAFKQRKNYATFLIRLVVRIIETLFKKIGLTRLFKETKTLLKNPKL